MYRVLRNPLAPSYERVKNLIFEQRFEWIFNPSSTEMDPKYKEEHTDAPFYSHIVIQRPEFQLYPEPQSKHCNWFVDCLEDIINVNIPTGIPYIFEFNDNFGVKRDYFLGNQDEILKKIENVSNQGISKD